jgi:hypothetical protein
MDWNASSQSVAASRRSRILKIGFAGALYLSFCGSELHTVFSQYPRV